MKVLFASDLHARPDQPQREKHFEYFLNKIAPSCEKLYLLGDIFEFGFVFNEKILPCYKTLVNHLVALVGSGTKVYFLGGNHDFWMETYLQGRGIQIVKEEDVHQILGRKVQLFHGILEQPDSLSRFADSLMRNPDAVWIYSHIPAFAGFRIALLASRLSRKRHKPFPKKIPLKRLKPFSPDADFVITGHHHDPLRFRYNSVEVLTTGNWFRDFTYVEMTEDGLEFKTLAVDPVLSG